MSIYINLRMRSSQRSVDTHCGGGADWIMPLECNSVGTSKGIDSINALFRPLLFFQTLAPHAFCETSLTALLEAMFCDRFGMVLLRSDAELS